jgi:hypothetical protein
MLAIVVSVPTVVIALLIIIMLWALFCIKVVMPLERKYVEPWIWRRLGGVGDPPDHQAND